MKHFIQWFCGLLLLGYLSLTVWILIAPCSGKGENRSATLAQFSNYMTALELFHREYGYYPTFLEGRSRVSLSDRPVAEEFFEALSGRTYDGKRISKHGNTNGIAFYSFSESELFWTLDLDYPLIVDRFDNPHIVLCYDHDGDGYVEVIEEGMPKLIRTKFAIYTIPVNGEETIATYLSR